MNSIQPSAVQNWPRRLARLLCVALAALAPVACGRDRSPRDQPTTTRSAISAPSSSESASAADPCTLLDPKEVEAALGSPLGTPPFLSRDRAPARRGPACEYEDAGLHSITVEVDWNGGAMKFNMFSAFQGMVDQHAKGLVHLADGTDLTGEWDEARVVACCSFAALRGDLLITVDVAGSKATIATAAKLADAALKRLDHRLPIDGARHVQPAIAFEAERRPKRSNPCALVNRTEAEAIVGPLSRDPTSIDDDGCMYDHAVQGTFAPTYVLKVRWAGGFSKYREENDTFATATKSLTGSMPLAADAKEAFAAAGAGDDLPPNPAWETAHWNIAGLSAVKKDVLVSIEPQGGRPADTVRLMEKVMSKF
jgi:hypothetical protein